MYQLETLAGRLAYALNVRKLSGRQAAGLLGVSQAAVSRWLRGERLPEADAILEMRVKLEISADWLLTGEGSPEPNRSGVAQYRSGRRDGLAEAREAIQQLEAAERAARKATSEGEDMRVGDDLAADAEERDLVEKARSRRPPPKRRADGQG